MRLLTTDGHHRSPNHVITFVRPKANQPPNLATFAVPLKFNKFDLRDYLFHVYGVEVRGVRSFINQMKPERANNGFGKWFRPKSAKMMVAELKKPFVWPERPAEAEREAFDYEAHEKIEKLKRERRVEQDRMYKAEIPLRTQVAVPEDRRGLREQAREFLANPGLWEDAPGVARARGRSVWTEVETESDFEEFEEAETEAGSGHIVYEDRKDAKER